MNRTPLNRYLKLIADRPFKYGDHDCLRFTNEAWRVMHGEGYGEDWVASQIAEGRPKLPQKLLKEFGHKTLDDALDSRLTRLPGGVPPFGALVASPDVRTWMVGYALGICVGAKCAFLSERGVVYKPVTAEMRAWV